MAFYCVGRDVEPLSNLLVTQTVGNQDDDFALAFRHFHCTSDLSFAILESEANDVSEK